jgi:3D (Asp-Asp-Asp) domain-containing protein
LTRHPEFRIAAIATLIVVCATTTSAAAVARHMHNDPHRSPTVLMSYTVSTTLANQPLDDARAADNPSVVASADEFYHQTKFDDLHGTTDVMRPSVHIVTEYSTHHRLLPLNPDVRLTQSLKPGQRKVLRAGSPALEDLTERVVMWDDVVVHRQIIHARVLLAGARGVVLQGAPLTWEQLAAATTFRKLVRVYDMEATAYTAWTATSNPTGRTATGIQATYGVVAVDPSVIRLGSHVFVPGYGLAIAADTGGAIVGNRIDLCMDSVTAALTFGRRPVKVYVLAE